MVKNMKSDISSFGSFAIIWLYIIVKYCSVIICAFWDHEGGFLLVKHKIKHA